MKHIILTLVFSLLIGHAHAVNNLTIDLDKISPDVAAQVLREQQRVAKEALDLKAAQPAPSAVPVTVSQAMEWSNVGANLAAAVAATARSLSVEVNEFIKTPAGWWTFAFIFWYLLGHTLWHIVGGIVVWIVLGGVIWHSFSLFHIPHRRIVTNNHGSKTYETVTYEFATKDGRVWSAIAHGVAFVVTSFVMLLIIF